MGDHKGDFKWLGLEEASDTCTCVLLAEMSVATWPTVGLQGSLGDLPYLCAQQKNTALAKQLLYHSPPFWPPNACAYLRPLHRTVTLCVRDITYSVNTSPQVQMSSDVKFSPSGLAVKGNQNMPPPKKRTSRLS